MIDETEGYHYIISSGKGLDFHHYFMFLLPEMRNQHVILTLLIFLIIPVLAFGQRGGSSVTQTVTIEVKPITKIQVTGNPGSLIITDTAMGEGMSVVSDQSSRYHMLTNLENMKIVASIDRPMPAGTQLRIQLGTHQGISAGQIDLSSSVSPVTVVTGIGRGSEINQSISYTFAAASTVERLDTDSRVVTLTLTD